MPWGRTFARSGMRAIRVERSGGPEVLRLQQIASPRPGPGEALVKVAVAGVNFIDTYHRRGLYPLELPFTPGVEAAGVVESVGEGVEAVQVGQRVAYALTLGAYAEYAVVPAWRLVPLPDGVELETAAAAMVQGLTAHYLTHSTFPLRPGQSALIHAAAGGTGLLATQMARLQGARVLGTASSPEKAALAIGAGAHHVILYEQDDFEQEVMQFTGGKGVHVVYDSVGARTFAKSLNCLRPRGMLVLFGQSSGPVPPVDPQVLNKKGSIFLTRPSLTHYAANRAELLGRTEDIFGWMRQRKLQIRIDRSFELAEAAEAHRALESRSTTGKVLLVL